MSQQQFKEILVLGGTGKRACAVAKELIKSGKYKVRLLVRDPNKQKAKKYAALGAKIYQGEMSSKESLKEAMKGVYGVFSVQYILEKKSYGN